MAKLSADDRKKFFSEKLEEQRHLLRAAIKAMSEGDLAQALHVATTIRVLVHETGASKPLLKHLGPNYLELPILDKGVPPASDVPPGKKAVVFWCPVSAQISAPAGTVGLITEMDGLGYFPSTLGAWWDTNPCMVLPGLGPVFRRELILGLANKEGGAHVDPDIPQRYQTVLDSQFFRAVVNNIDLGALRISRLVAGRAGLELLDCLERNFPVPIAQPAKS